MTRQLLDSVTAARLPADARLVGAYVDGHYANVAAVRARCPRATVVTITVLGTAGANVADCEPGDLTPASAADWAAREIAAGRKPTIYCNLSTWPSVQTEVAKRRITVSYWIAHYDGKAEMIPGAVAKQYQERTDQNLDYSIAADYWPGVDPPPAKPHALPDISQPKPAPQEDDMARSYSCENAQWITDGIHTRWLRNSEDVIAQKTIGTLVGGAPAIPPAVHHSLIIVGATPPTR